MIERKPSRKKSYRPFAGKKKSFLVRPHLKKHKHATYKNRRFFRFREETLFFKQADPHNPYVYNNRFVVFFLDPNYGNLLHKD
jgi:hypothetical protein